MRKIILSLAAVAAVSAGAAGAASAAPNAGLDFNAQNNAGIQKVSYGHGYGRYHRKRCRRLRFLAHQGSRWAMAKYNRICRGYSRVRICKRLHYKGFVLGNPGAKYRYYRLCRGYGWGGKARFCKRLYYKAFVLGQPGAKFRYYRHCAPRRHVRY